MSHRIWLDRTIGAARDADIRMPWARRPAPERAVETGDRPADASA